MYGCFSQWYEAPFDGEGQRFPTAEHYLMYSKAVLFKDHVTASQILKSPSPEQVKALGRSVSNFDEAIWSRAREGIAVKGNTYKFQQHPALLGKLIETRGMSCRVWLFSFLSEQFLCR